MIYLSHPIRKDWDLIAFWRKFPDFFVWYIRVKANKTSTQFARDKRVPSTSVLAFLNAKLIRNLFKSSKNHPPCSITVIILSKLNILNTKTYLKHIQLKNIFNSNIVNIYILNLNILNTTTQTSSTQTL